MEKTIIFDVEKSLKEIKNNYKKDRYVFIEGKLMEKILIEFGATEHELLQLKSLGNNLNDDPTLAFRKSKNGRFCLDLENKLLSRLKFEPFILHKEEGFVRKDSDSLRKFHEIQNDLQYNLAFLALIKFKSYIIDDFDVSPRKNLVQNSLKWLSTIFHLRTITTSALIGEPAKEGVHSDGVEHSMSTFVYSSNITENSAISEVHYPEQKTGIKWNETNKNYVKATKQHKHFLDTLLIVDNELKHSVSNVDLLRKEKEGIRDMLIFFTRRPKDVLHPSAKYDTFEEHAELPLKFRL